MKNFRITISSPPDREDLVAEIFYNSCQWAEINQKTEDLIIQFYLHPDQPYWEFDLNEALEALAEAKKRLVAMETKR